MLLISSCPVNQVKSRKVAIIASEVILTILFPTFQLLPILFQRGKNVATFCSAVKNSTDFLVLEVSTDSKIESVFQARRKKIKL